MNSALQKLEAVLFTSASAVAKKQLMRVISCDEAQLADLLEDLREKRKESGVVVIDDGLHVALVTNPSLEDFMEHLRKEDQAASLSRAMQETLSIIAYTGPIAKIDLDFLRGVNTQYILRRLTMRGLIQDERKGRMRMVLVTTDFLLHLGIQDVTELREYARIRQTILDGLQAVKRRAEEEEV